MKKKLLSLLLAGVLGASMLAGCGAQEEGSSNAPAASAEAGSTEKAADNTAGAAEGGEEEEEEENYEDMDEEDMPHLVMSALLFAPVTQENLERVGNYLNELTKKKMGCTIEVQWLGASEYLTNIPMMLQAGEQLDLLMFTPIPVCGYQSFMNQKQLMDITDLIDEYGPDIKAIMGDYLEATSQDGKIYGVGNMQSFEQYLSFDMRKDILEELGLLEKAEALDSYQGVLEILEEVVANKDINGIVNSDAEGTVISTQPFVAGNGAFADAEWLDNCGDSYFLTYADPADNKIKCFYENQKWQDSIKLIREWYNKGVVYKDAQTNQESGLGMIRSEVGFCDSSATELGAEAQAENTTGFPDLNVEVTPAKVSTNTFQKFGFAVPVTAEYPEEAVEFLNLMWSDPEIYNTLTWGVEGEDWEVNADGMACFPEGKSPENTYHTADFFYGNRLEIIPWEGQDKDIRQQMKDSNDAMEISEFFGFSVDSTNVANQITAVKAVVDSYKPGLSSGAMGDDVDAKIQEMVSKMYDAGMQEIIDEYQSQLDAWLATK